MVRGFAKWGQNPFVLLRCVASKIMLYKHLPPRGHHPYNHVIK